jgi:Diacylglycerol kinase catalytic domain
MNHPGGVMRPNPGLPETQAMQIRRMAAGAALLLALASVVTAAVSTITNFPRGLIVLMLAVFALIVAWYGALRRGIVRLIAILAGAVALAAALVLLLSPDPVESVIVVGAAIAALIAARAAFAVRAHLPAVEPPKQPVLIFNPRSGGGKATRFKLDEEARKRGIEPVELTPGTTLAKLVDEALARGADALAMAGGDGSQAAVAAAAARAGIPFACIPAGTRNHFALDLGVDRDDVVGALDAFVCGGEHRVDLAEVNGRVFVNNVSLGLYADAVQHAGYRDAKLRTLLDTIPEVAGRHAEVPPLHWRDAQGRTHQGGLALLVSNNPYRLGRAVGSGTRPRLDTASLGVAVLAPQAGIRRGLLRLWSLPALEVESDARVPAGIDGEAATLEAPLHFKSRPGALRVRISVKHPGASPSAALPDRAWGAVRALARIAVAGDR